MTREKRKTERVYRPVLMALIAAFVYGAAAPVSKILLQDLPPIFLAGLLYCGAGFGMLLVGFIGKDFHKKENQRKEANLGKEDLIWVLGMILLDVLAPILLLLGLSRISSANASLLFNFEIVTTTLVAALIFKEAIGKRLLLAIVIITVASMILSFEDFSAFQFSIGSLLVLGACVAWGFENNCTRNISGKSPLQIVVLKGVFAGLTSVTIGLITEKVSFHGVPILAALLTGFIGYGLSVFFYVRAQRDLGAARTSTYYAIAPFAGVFFSFLLFGTGLNLKFCVAFTLMVLGAYFAVSEAHKHAHLHVSVTHEHSHSHDDMHHGHSHEGTIEAYSGGNHSHVHTHEETEHIHKHTPDIHHRHGHK